VHFWISFVCINGIFMPMFAQGLAGVSRRLYDGGQQYEHAKVIASQTNPFMSICAIGLLIGQTPFVINFSITPSPGCGDGAPKTRIRGRQRRSIGGDLFAAARARQLRGRAGRLSRTVRVQPTEDPDSYIPQHIPERTAPEPETVGGTLPAVAVAQREI